MSRSYRVLVLILTSLAIALNVAALFQDWWQLWLYAPQYPNGLRLDIRLTRIGGDVHEVDMLNHYIGMGHLEAAAALEQQIGAYAVGVLCLAMAVVALVPGRRASWLLPVLGAVLPLGFLADAFAWMWWYGHHLDPRAPLHIAPFTPRLLGVGVIGQFRTYARPQLGFWLSCMAFGVLALAGLLRARGSRRVMRFVAPPPAGPERLAGAGGGI